ncbi:MAG TPA: Rid family hydrolase, partial [Myxococcales bacterium]|nr:Rid family hydrolase [Myxococcales bacterium]
MRMIPFAALALVACAHQSANAPETAAAAVPSEPAAAASQPAAPAAVEPASTPAAAPAVAAIPVERRAVQSASAPKAVGPYSPAIQAPANRVLFVSSQIGVDPVKDRLITGDAAKQTERVMQNLKAVL